MKTIVFTHNDLDGVACGIVALCYFPDANVHYCSYTNIEDVIYKFLKLNKEKLSDYRIIISDISIKSDSVLNDTLRRRLIGSLIIADHHKTSIWMNSYNFNSHQAFRTIEADGNRSAALLLHELLRDTHCGNEMNGETFIDRYPVVLDKFVEVVSDWDTWGWTERLDNKNVDNSMKTNASYYLSTLMTVVGIQTFVSRFVMAFQSSEIKENNLGRLLTWEEFLTYLFTKEELDAATAVIEASFESMGGLILEHKTIKTKRYGDIEFDYIVLQDYSQTSIASEYINQKKMMNPSSSFLAMVSGLTPKGVSLRLPAKGIDLSVIASEFSGGGHFNAAGCDYNEFTKNVNV